MVGLSLPGVHEDALALVDAGVRAAARLVHEASALRRERCDLADLCVAVECGHSDATSGLVCNPLAGRMMEAVVGAGGQAMFSETVEWTGAEHLLARRAATPDVARRIVDAVRERERMVRESGGDLRAQNPGPQNKAGGITTLEEKALGAIAKGGGQPIRDVLRAAQRPPAPGLYLMDTPFFSPESITAMVAGGAQIVVLHDRRRQQLRSLIAPTLKMSANPGTASRLEADRLRGGRRAAGTSTLDELCDARGGARCSRSRPDRSPTARSSAKATKWSAASALRCSSQAVERSPSAPSGSIRDDKDNHELRSRRHAPHRPARRRRVAARRGHRAVRQRCAPADTDASVHARFRRAVRRRPALLRHRAVLRPGPRRAPPRRVPARRRSARADGLVEGRAADATARGGVAPGASSGAYPFEVAFDYSYDGALRSLDAQLQRLGTNRIDIALMHDVNRRWQGDLVEQRYAEAMSGAYRALAELRDAGVIKAIGVGVNDWEILLRFAADGDFDCFMLAGRYTLLDHTALDASCPTASGAASRC